MASNYPPGVTGNEPQITGIIDPDSLIDFCKEEVKKASDIVEDVLRDLDDQGVPLDADVEDAALDSLQNLIDSIEDERPLDYDPRDSRI